jgi:2-dehydropantoate 2-reductase
MYDLIIIAVKVKDTKLAAKACNKHLAKGGAVLALQNGIDNLSMLEAVFGCANVVGGVVNSGISVPESGKILYKPNPKITIGGVNNEAKRHDEPLKVLFLSAGVLCSVSADIRRTAWLKLLWNAAYNPLSAITKATCGELSMSNHAMTLMYGIASEAMAAALANGVDMPDNAVKKALDLKEEYKNYKTSALQDVEANRVPETEEILSPILKAADDGLISAPVTRSIAELSGFMFERWFHSYPRLAADVVVVDTNGAANVLEYRVLLIERKFPPFGWALPGGMAELGETIEHTAARELQEETGIEVAESDLVLLGVYSDPARDARGHTVGVVYYAFANATPTAADDAKNAQYFALGNLPALAFDHARVLQDLVTRL